MLVPLATSGNVVPVKHFWKAVFLYHDRPHIVNRKLGGATTLHFYRITYDNPSLKLTEIINYTSISYETNKLKELTKESLTNLVTNLVEPYDKNVVTNEIEVDECKEVNDGVFVGVRVLHSSNASSDDCVEVCLLDKSRNVASFVAVTSRDKYKLIAPPFSYSLEFSGTGHVTLVTHVDNAETGSAEWLVDKLFPKFVKWAEEYDDCKAQKQSLTLVPIERYCSLYKELKARYGLKMVEIWPENTDPLKFVYEDVAIATYLICLWERTHPEKKPSFVDLGCGNGLLVYILAQEGFPGFGIDVRPRKIWSLYPENVKLEVKTIIPSDSSLFPQADWIIGNHSDELTPWIPVIASRSSTDTNFFVIPCCCYDFNGRKYMRKNSGGSQYNEYLEYVAEISGTCGFDVQTDRLRIPSTKRTCLVGRSRLFTTESSEEIDEGITRMLNANDCGGSRWINDFRPRVAAEKVRNCTQLNRGFIIQTVKNVVTQLLETNNLISKYDGSKWNAGGQQPLSVLINRMDSLQLKHMKDECGGLQTLLKNHRYIFDVGKGLVKLRVPPLFEDVSKYKDKPCWFLRNHPDGCLNDDRCAYKHLILE